MLVSSGYKLQNIAFGKLANGNQPHFSAMLEDSTPKSTDDPVE
jgi:hypothetical protein